MAGWHRDSTPLLKAELRRGQVQAYGGTAVIVRDNLFGVFQTRSSMTPSFPAGVQDVFNLPFFKSFNLNGWWQFLSLARDRVSSGRAEQAGIEYRMYPHASRQVKLISMQANNLSNAEWS